MYSVYNIKHIVLRLALNKPNTSCKNINFKLIQITQKIEKKIISPENRRLIKVSYNDLIEEIRKLLYDWSVLASLF